MNYPMREKYVDKAIGVYFEFGVAPDGTVDISDGTRDVFERLPKELAQKVIAAHHRFREELYELLCKDTK